MNDYRVTLPPLPQAFLFGFSANDLWARKSAAKGELNASCAYTPFAPGERTELRETVIQLNAELKRRQLKLTRI